MSTIVSLLVNAGAFYIAAKFLSGVKIRGFWPAILLVIGVCLLNVFLGPLLKVFSLGILSLGIFKWILDAILITIADYFIDDVEIKNFWWALFLAGLVSIIDGILSGVIN